MTIGNSLSTRFFDQGLELLAHGGYASLKLTPLCKALSVSTGAFYHSFANWKDYTTRLLEYWRQDRTMRLVELAEAHSEAGEQLDSLLLMAIELPHRAEAAIRSWSQTDPDVAAVQKTVDQERYGVIYRAFLELVGDARLADHYSRAGMYLLIGFEQGESLQSKDALRWSLQQLRDAASV